MKRFDRHILRRLIVGVLGLIVALVASFVIFHYVEHVDDFLDRGATLRMVFLGYYPHFIPEIVRLTSPLAIFMASVYLTGKLAQELQIASLQTAGVSLYRLLRSYLVVGLALSGFMFWFNGWVVPQSQVKVLDFETKFVKKAARELQVGEIHRQNGPGSVITVGYYDRESETGHRVSMQQFKEGRTLMYRLDAPRMEWVDSLKRWRLYSASMRRFTPEGREVLKTADRLDTVLNVLPRDFARTQRDVETMTLPDAENYIQVLRRSGSGGVERAQVTYYSRILYPLANLILVLIAVPLAATRRRGGQAVQLGLGVITAFFYLALQKLTEPFGYTGEFSPVLAAAVPHIIFGIIALVMLAAARK